MKRVLALVPAVLIVAACTTPARHQTIASMPPPPPPPLRPGEVPSHTPAGGGMMNAPQHVQSVGPLKTAMVSSYMDVQERDLRVRLRAYGVNIARRGDTMVLNVNNAVLFNGNALSPSGNNFLVALSTILRRYDHSAVNVAGYTDTTGDPDQNMKVSQKRARAIADELARDGVAQARLSAQGFGETNLKVRTGDSVAEPRNRRIEIRIAPTPMG